jgi:hypothetical protein
MRHVPPVLLRYIERLKAHDVDLVADTVADDLVFISATARWTSRSSWRCCARCTPASRLALRPRSGGRERRRIRGEMAPGGTHNGTWTLAGMDPIAPTGKRVQIPEHYFFYKVRGDRIVEIRPEPIRGGAPRGILEQIGVALPPL